ncbi:MAG: hypothetical protein FWE50_04645 [Alphaproteobacteria bacterium]|nr:hypothetical protein [Alphaproteobacteria bacterium]
MFDQTLVVQSAVSSFNNIALRSPDFFWSALLCLPIFAVFWFFSTDISARFLKGGFDNKVKTISTWGMAFVAFWLLTHSNFSVLRDGVSFGISVLTAVCVFIFSVFAGQRLLPVSQFFKIKDKWRKKFDISVPALAAVLIGLCAWYTWQSVVTQFGAAAIGFALGYFMKKSDRQGLSPDFTMLFLFGILTFGLVMQPEFFRFGQLGNLTIIHILFLMAALFAIVGSVMQNMVKPRGWLKNSWYKKLMWLARAMAVLIFVLFVLTESAIIFLASAVIFSLQAFLAIRHRSPADAVAVKSASEDLWVLSLCLFGILTAMPVLVCGAILLMRAKPKMGALGAIKALL